MDGRPLITKLPSQFANKDGGFNWWGFAIIALSVGVMTFQIIDICKGWKIAQKEKEQQKQIDQMQTEITELKTLHQKYMPSANEHDGSKKTLLPEKSKQKNPFNFSYTGFKS